MRDLYEQYEGEILNAIDEVFEFEWWKNLSDDVQEQIHDKLFNVLSDKPQETPE
jgi:hypothetical protein